MREQERPNVPPDTDILARMHRIEQALAALTRAVTELKFDMSDLNVPRKGLADLKKPGLDRF